MRVFFTGTETVEGFYNDEDHVNIPEGAVEITSEERDFAIEAQAKGKVLCITDGKITPQDRPDVDSDWVEGKWVVNTELHNKVMDGLRASAFSLESDPLYFKEQRGEVPEGTWVSKVAEIRSRFPKI